MVASSLIVESVVGANSPLRAPVIVIICKSMVCFLALDELSLQWASLSCLVVVVLVNAVEVLSTSRQLKENECRRLWHGLILLLNSLYYHQFTLGWTDRNVCEAAGWLADCWLCLSIRWCACHLVALTCPFASFMEILEH